MNTRPFCKTLPYTVELKKWRENQPIIEFWYTPRGKCIMYINGVRSDKLPHHKTDNQHESTGV